MSQIMDEEFYKKALQNLSELEPESWDILEDVENSDGSRELTVRNPVTSEVEHKTVLNIQV